METKKPFSDIIGQESIKPMLQYYIESNHAGNPLPSFMLVAPKGCGKTTIAKEMAKAFVTKEKVPRERRILNCASLKKGGLSAFFKNVLVPHVNDKDVTLVMDEASELPRDVTMGLLTMLNPNKEKRNTFSYDDYEIEIDFSRQTFIFATTDPDQVHTALMDRTKRIDLEDYKISDIGRMVLLNAVVEKSILDDVASVCRGNARSAYQFSEDIGNFLKTRNARSLNANLWNDFKKIQNVLPLGLSRIELVVLRLLNQLKDATLTRLTAATGLSATALRRDIELYLMKMGLMEVGVNSRRAITAKGQAYLKDLDKQQIKA